MNIRVSAPPSKPLIIYDGECRFCCRWIATWKRITAGRVDYSASQETEVTALYPEVPAEAYDKAVQLIETDGSVYSGPEAVFRSLSYTPDKQWLFWCYQHLRGFSWVTETAYRFIASHRQFFSKLTRWFLPPEPSEFYLLRSLFLRGLGLIYFFAFFSLATQIIGLSGERGIVPTAEFMNAAQDHVSGSSLSRWSEIPTFCWWGASDDSLRWQCFLGIGFSLALLVGVIPLLSLLMLWLLYLSLSYACGPFLSFQWDILLLETGFLAMFFAPLTWKTDSRERASIIVIWLFRWLLFRLMFESGLAKLASDDPTWSNFTALTYHYETQPLPTFFAWYAHHGDLWLHKFNVVLTFIIELVLPFLIFAPWRARWLAFWGFVLLQVAIILTGNYAFFNLLTLLLSFTLLDDRMLRSLAFWKRKRGLNVDSGEGHGLATSAFQTFGGNIRRVVFIPVTLVILLCTAMQLGSFAGVQNWPNAFIHVYNWFQPFRSVNAYGFFAVMTTTRPEIVIEGSEDGGEWREYEFKFKPGDLKRAPSFIAPHQPRLDWQMWFAALSDYRNNPWFVNFAFRLLQGQPSTLRLLGKNPFPGRPPKFIRAKLYLYKFTSPDEKRRSGAWWKRDPQGDYLPVISLENFEGADNSTKRE